MEKKNGISNLLIQFYHFIKWKIHLFIHSINTNKKSITETEQKCGIKNDNAKHAEKNEKKNKHKMNIVRHTTVYNRILNDNYETY